MIKRTYDNIKNIHKAVIKGVYSDKVLIDILYEICKNDAPYCNTNCPVFFFNDNQRPTGNKDHQKFCKCYKDGLKMLEYVRDKKE